MSLDLNFSGGVFKEEWEFSRRRLFVEIWLDNSEMVVT
jgi:hypothetical protein